jgi:Mg-chelatase subunit ChlD
MGILLVATVVGAFVATQLYNQAACPRLQNIAIGLVAAGVLFFIEIYALFIAADNNFANVGGTIAVVALLTLFVPAFLGARLRSVPELSESFCETCERAEQAREQRVVFGELDAAQSLAEACLSETSDAVCRSDCGCELAQAYFERAAQFIEVRNDAATEVELMAASEANQTYRCGLDATIAERQSRATAVAMVPPPTPTPAPSPTPTPAVYELEELRTNVSGNVLSIDLRVKDQGFHVADIPSGVFTLTVDDQPVTEFEVRESRADDPSCIVAVLDNSGSVNSGLTQISEAVNIINEQQQAADELGMVTFAEQDRVVVVQQPTNEFPLPSNAVNASGQRTALWDGVNLGIQQANTCESDNRFLIVMTDGSDNTSEYLSDRTNDERAAALARAARQASVRVCTIGVAEAQGAPELTILAENSGCEHFAAENFDAIASKVQQIVGGTREFYRIQADNMSLTHGSHSFIVGVEASPPEVIDYDYLP